MRVFADTPRGRVRDSTLQRLQICQQTFGTTRGSRHVSQLGGWRMDEARCWKFEHGDTVGWEGSLDNPANSYLYARLPRNPAHRPLDRWSAGPLCRRVHSSRAGDRDCHVCAAFPRGEAGETAGRIVKQWFDEGWSGDLVSLMKAIARIMCDVEQRIHNRVKHDTRFDCDDHPHRRRTCHPHPHR